MGKTFIDYFSGVGGFRLGMEMAGHECVGHCERDKFANMSYQEMHNPKGSEWFGEDIRRVRADELPRADIWCFGFPCQDISVAGKQLGFKGNRSSLFFTVTKLIRDTKEEDRPSILFIENVKNLLSVNGGYDFLKLLIELDEIGYDAEWQVLNSKNFGVPQNRERVFIIGHIRGQSRREVFPISGSNSETLKQLVDGSQGMRVYDSKGLSVCLSANGGGQGAKTGLYLVSNSNEVKCLNSKDTNGKQPPQQDRVYDTKGIMIALQAEQGGRFNIRVNEATKKGYAIAHEGDSINLEQLNSKTRRGRVGKGIAQTLNTSCNQATLVNDRIRRLTPLECFRLQGFPDEYFYRAATVCSDNQLYKQAGNGVTVTVIYEIAKRF